ncbi:MAG: PGPGW domain-containing protein [Syntrophales bacterium]|nr:PGPGW domain-containing protein [Syntrophales bacterium]
MNIVTALFAWARCHSSLLWGASVVSLVTFIGTVAALPFLVARIPEDYFLRSERHFPRRYENSPARLLYLIVRNLAGAVFVMAGIVMLFIPGQGILTILIGIMLMSFPGKRLLALRTIRQPTVFGAVNWIRARSGRPPLVLPQVDSVKHDRKTVENMDSGPSR